MIPQWARHDDEVREEFLAALERMYPEFRRDDVLAFHVSRVRYVLAVSTLDYSSGCLPPVRTSLSNVFVANSAQIANGTLNVNETIGLANTQAACLADILPRARRTRGPLGRPTPEAVSVMSDTTRLASVSLDLDNSGRI